MIGAIRFISVLCFCLSLLMTPTRLCAAAEVSQTAAGEPIVPSVDFGFAKLIDQLQQQKANGTASAIERLELKNELFRRILKVSYEIRVVTNKIDREIADADQRRAVLAERRDRAVRINTYADFLSGGITGIVGGGMKLRDINHIAPDIIDTVEGGVQTGLSAWALQQQRGEQKIERTSPGLLAPIMDPNLRSQRDFSDDIWTFLNTTPPGGGQSLRETLKSRWIKSRFCFQHTGHRMEPKERMKHMALVHPRSNRITIDLLEDRIAMLHDLRATVTQLDEELLGIITKLQSL